MRIYVGEKKTTQRRQDDAQIYKVKMSPNLFFLLIKIVLLRFMIAHRNGFHACGDLPAPQYVLSNKSTTPDTLQKR